MSHRHRHAKFQSLLEFTEDEFELIELLKDAESLNAQAENIRTQRNAELKLVKEKLRSVRARREGIRPTDHAVIRYLERVKSYDVESLRREMISHIPNDGTGDPSKYEYVAHGDLVYVVRDNLIVTIRPEIEVAPA